MFAIITFSFLSSKVVNACETAKVWFRECLLAILEFFRYLPPSPRVPIFRQVIEEWKFWLWDALNLESGNNNVRHDTTFRFVGTYWNLNRRHQNMPKQTSLPPKYLHKAIQLCNFFTILVNNTVSSADCDQATTSGILEVMFNALKKKWENLATKLQNPFMRKTSNGQNNNVQKGLKIRQNW